MSVPRHQAGCAHSGVHGLVVSGGCSGDCESALEGSDTVERDLSCKTSAVREGQGCESSFSKELSSQFKFLGHQELLFSSSSTTCMHELSYSSVQFHQLVWVRAIDLKAGKDEKGNRIKSSCFAQDFLQHTKVLC